MDFIPVDLITNFNLLFNILLCQSSLCGQLVVHAWKWMIWNKVYREVALLGYTGHNVAVYIVTQVSHACRIS